MISVNIIPANTKNETNIEYVFYKHTISSILFGKTAKTAKKNKVESNANSQIWLLFREQSKNNRSPDHSWFVRLSGGELL